MRSYDESSGPVSFRPKQQDNQRSCSLLQAPTSAKSSRGTCRAHRVVFQEKSINRARRRLATANGNYHIATTVRACFHSGLIALEQFAWTRRSRRG
ncbi:hypothetical protein Y032_0317g2311 [Ancylostoma ceylanicum]|uniref:Uncharacterized protein n=1 Tax=Ancylostoma ceylanicum TaxID=53326 RepID=A0A016S1I9_9BILA|nr:hypothetical protein Y032_0317g2311 [Ancylostoma ceylanicum]